MKLNWFERSKFMLARWGYVRPRPVSSEDVELKPGSAIFSSRMKRLISEREKLILNDEK